MAMRYTPTMPPKKTQAEQKPTNRKVIVRLTDDEWRAVRVTAAASDTSIQGFITDLVLREIQSRHDGALAGK